jgi:hypothetical protein
LVEDGRKTWEGKKGETSVLLLLVFGALKRGMG